MHEAIIGCGLSGYGKSYHTARIIKQYPRVLICSPYPADDYGRVSTVIELKDLSYSTWNAKRFRLSFAVPAKSHEENYGRMEALSAWIWAQLPECLFVVDEIQRFRLTPKGELPPSFYKLMDEGRHRNISTLGVARRPVQFAPIQRSLAKTVFTFRLNSHNDVRELDDWFGDYAEEVRELPRFQRMEYTSDDSAIRFYDKNNNLIRTEGAVT